MKYETLEWEQKGSLAYLTISRPKSLNALNSKVLEELCHLLKTLKGTGLRTLILKGAGEKAFVAGADIKEMSEMNSRQAGDFAKKGQEVCSLLESLPFPVIAVIQGFALGGGLELALASDILIIDEKGKVGLPEVSLGLFPAFGGSQRLPRAIGFYRAKEMILTGSLISAEEAHKMGLVSAIVPKEKLLPRALAYASTFEKKGPLALFKAKKLIQKTRDPGFEEGLKQEVKDFVSLFESSDSREGMQAFIEKREANFQGK